MAEQVVNGKRGLAGLREFRPVPRNRRFEIEQLAIDQVMRSPQTMQPAKVTTRCVRNHDGGAPNDDGAELASVPTVPRYWRLTMSTLEVTAHMTIRKGKVEGFKRKAAEIIEQAKQLDTKTLRYDWYINGDQTACEVRELYASPLGLVEHRMHVGKALDELFAEFADDHAVTVYGERTPELLALAAHTKGVDITWYSPL